MASTYKLLLEYEGSRYRGWQDQQNAPRTVMGVLRRALEEAGAEVVDLGGAGRTDAGVHALAQAAHLRLAAPRDPARLREAVNAALPADVHVLALVPASERFHARHNAVCRSYLYQISRRRSAFGKPFVWWIRDPLDLGAMRTAAALFVGRHDYRAFSAAPEGPKSTLVEVEKVEIVEAGSLVLIRVVASHFLWKMVRRMVGTLVRVATGQLRAADVAALLAGEVRSAADDPARFTAPPSGLFLERVVYEGDASLGPVRPAVPIEPEPAMTPPRAIPRSRPRPPRQGGP